jgi:glyoxalase family protein
VDRQYPPPVVLLQADATTPDFQLGAGLTHHFAMQVADVGGLVAWRDFLNDAGVPTTDLKDRRYFESIYFRDPDGHVLEIATTGPGFTVDEPQSQLGQHLTLPPWLEDRRSEIVRRLPPLITH